MTTTHQSDPKAPSWPLCGTRTGSSTKVADLGVTCKRCLALTAIPRDPS